MDSYLRRTPISFLSTSLWRGSLELFGVVVVEEKRNLPDGSTVKTGKLITESETGSPNLQTKNNSQTVGSDSVVISKLITQSGSCLLRQEVHELENKAPRREPSSLFQQHRSALGVAMRSPNLLRSSGRNLRQLRRPCGGVHGRRAIQISATPTTETPILTGDVLSNSIDASADPAGWFFLEKSSWESC
jgi:hypothetical protein